MLIYTLGTRKPEELYHIAEHFCLGTRRLELFGGVSNMHFFVIHCFFQSFLNARLQDHNLRPGWLTVGCDLSYSNFTVAAYMQQFAMNGRVLQSSPSKHYLVARFLPILILMLPCVGVEELRPKSPPPREMQKKKLVENIHYPDMHRMEPIPQFIYSFPMPVVMPPAPIPRPHLMLPPW
jgi:hypothetical protein